MILYVLIILLIVYFLISNKEGFTVISESNIMENKVYLDDKIYDNFYTFYYDEMIISIHYYEELLTLVKHHLYEGLILCLNSRNGHIVQLLPNSIGIDSSKSMVKMSQYKYPDNTYILGSPLKKSIFKDNKFTHILCPLLSIHTIRDINQLFENVSDWLIYTGLFIICIADIKTLPLHKLINHNPSHSFSLNYAYSTEITNNKLIEKITDKNYKTRKNIQTLYDYNESTIISKCKPYGLHVIETYKMSVPFTVLVMQKKSI
jgi:hypothetical protein